MKELCFVLERSRWTVWRWKVCGCPWVAGRTTLRAVVQWLTLMEMLAPAARADFRRRALARVKREK